MIDDSKAERAVAYLRDSAEEAAQARANVLYIESWLKVVKAQQMKLSPTLPVAVQEREALVSDAYSVALEGYKAAVEADSAFRFKRESAVALLEAWRTQQANIRGMQK